jgi:FlaA1/EpsC-like NDP-sugar epimerase
MGQPVRILGLAEDLIRLSGLEPYKDIEIVFTGMRPGEKLSEVLWEDGAIYEPTEHPDITRLVEEEIVSGRKLETVVDELIRLAYAGDEEEIIELLDATIPGSSIRSAPPTDLTSMV